MNDIATSNIARAAKMNGGRAPTFSRVRTVDGLDVSATRARPRRFQRADAERQRGPIRRDSAAFRPCKSSRMPAPR